MRPVKFPENQRSVCQQSFKITWSLTIYIKIVSNRDPVAYYFKNKNLSAFVSASHPDDCRLVFVAHFSRSSRRLGCRNRCPQPAGSRGILISGRAARQEEFKVYRADACFHVAAHCRFRFPASEIRLVSLTPDWSRNREVLFGGFHLYV